MTIFCDTNIIMEFLEQRKFAAQVRQILTYSTTCGNELFISYGSFYTITYLVERYLKEDKSLDKVARLNKLRYILNGVLEMFKLADQYPGSISDGVNDSMFDDLEDSYQAHVALNMTCDVLLTINTRHFTRFAAISPVEVLSPEAFVSKYISNFD